MQDYQVIPLILTPGVYKEGSPLAAKNRFVDANNIRFYNGYPEKIGGYVAFSPSSQTLAEPARAALQWVANDGTKLYAWASANHFYVYTIDTRYDVTPVGLPVGNIDPAQSLGGGWGDVFWGGAPWGGVQSATSLPPTTTTIAKWGQDCLFNQRGSAIYWWQYANGYGTAAAAVGGTAPTDSLGVMVSNLTRTAFSLGRTSDPLNLQWPSKESLTDWVASATNTAGNQRLEQGTQIMGATDVLGGQLVLTDFAAYLVTFTGVPYWMGVTQQGANCGLIGPKAATNLDGIGYWMGSNNHFYSYSGAVQPLPCDVEKYVFSNINLSCAWKIQAYTVAAKGEVGWLYPSSSATENDSFVACNVRDGTRPWSIGTGIPRTTFLDAGVSNNFPVATDSSGNLWQHETGTDAGTSALPYSLTTSELEIDSYGGIMNLNRGRSFARLRKVHPDNARISGTHQFSLYCRNYPQSATFDTIGPFSYSGTTEKISVWGRGRSIQANFAASALGTDIRWGEWRADVRAAGDRG